jgi:hypothetical protein
VPGSYLGSTELRDVVRAKYAAAATATTEHNAICCSAEGAIITDEQREQFGSPLSGQADREQLPDAAVLASLGCGNPIAIAELQEGETVLDLGSGGGIDVLLSAKRVGPTGLGVRAGHDRRDARPRPGGTKPKPASPTCNGSAVTSNTSRLRPTAST